MSEREDSGEFEVPDLPTSAEEKDADILRNEVRRQGQRILTLEASIERHESKLRKLRVWIEKLLRRDETPHG